MCQFCHQHGEGRKWYLQAKNYSDDLLSDVRRRNFIKDFIKGKVIADTVQGMARLEKAPAFLRGLLGRLATRRMKREHFGQVVPLEDVEQIFGFCNSITRVSCVCRQDVQVVFAGFLCHAASVSG